MSNFYERSRNCERKSSKIAQNVLSLPWYEDANVNVFHAVVHSSYLGMENSTFAFALTPWLGLLQLCRALNYIIIPEKSKFHI